MFRFTRITLGLSYFLNVLLLFLLLFEDKVQLPVFLQVTGRMHPLVLHFPLTLLFVGIVMEYLSTRPAFQHPAVLKIVSFIFHLFALSAAVTALFGFFLYKEGSYSGEQVALHKWLGLAVSLLSLIILILKEKTNLLVYYATLGISAICLIVAGHVGAEITHGQGFLTEPMRNQHAAPGIHLENPDSAVVFRDVVQPILNEKCISCHNPNRAKNDLVLSDYESMMKGGESHDIVVAGKAERSLLFKYIMLPMNDTLHMPPAEKLQLDREEIKLIGWWINSGAHADEKYVNLPKVDSIQTIMAAKFHPKSGIDLLDIAFVDYEEIKRLNNPYRTVQQISATQPYIAVFLGSKKNFSATDLTELKAIGSQVISIDLGNSDVKDDDLKSLAEFPHLQKLHLQNTSIGDDGIKHLKELHYLSMLNLSGTKVSTHALEEITGWQPLKKLYVYNTQIPETWVASAKKSHPQLEVYNTRLDLSDSVYNAALTVPVVKIDSPFFHQQATLEVKLSRGKVKYFYTLDGSKPTHSSTVYKEPFQIRRSGEFKVIATMEGWIDSKVATFPLMKVGVRPRRVVLETQPDPKYAGNLDSTLVDGKSGGLSRGDKEYLGYVARDAQILFELDQPAERSEMTLSYLEDVGNGVLAPRDVEVWGGTTKNNMIRLTSAVNTSSTEKISASSTEKTTAAKRILTIHFTAQNVKVVRLKLKKARTLPAGYTLQKDLQPSIFIDEVSLD